MGLPAQTWPMPMRRGPGPIESGRASGGTNAAITCCSPGGAVTAWLPRNSGLPS